MIRRTLALHFARASKRPAPVPKPLAASAAFIPPPPPPPPRTAAAPVNAASSRNGLDGRIAPQSHTGHDSGKSASSVPPAPLPVKASNSEFVDELTDNTGTGLAFGTVVVTLSALFGAHVVHSILKPDLVRNLALRLWCLFFLGRRYTLPFDISGASECPSSIADYSRYGERSVRAQAQAQRGRAESDVWSGVGAMTLVLE